MWGSQIAQHHFSTKPKKKLAMEFEANQDLLYLLKAISLYLKLIFVY